MMIWKRDTYFNYFYNYWNNYFNEDNYLHEIENCDKTLKNAVKHGKECQE